MPRRHLARAVPLAVLALLGCSSNPTAGKLRSIEPEMGQAHAPAKSEQLAHERRRIQTYLAAKFRAARISPDLLRIVMSNVDSAITGVRIPEAERAHPRTTSFPSVARQIVWQAELNEIAAGFERDFFLVRRRGPVPDVFFEDAPRELPSVNLLGLITVSAIKEAQGHVSEELRERPLPPDLRFQRTPSKPRDSLGAYAQPVRIAPTNIALVDETIPRVLADIRPRFPRSKLDDASFPAPASAANLIIPPQRFGGYGRWKALACAREIYCESFADFTRNYAPGEPKRSAAESFPFLDSIYLTNPYGERNGITAVVQLDRAGSIVAAFCSIDDIRYSPGRIDGPPLNPKDLRTCLEQAMGY